MPYIGVVRNSGDNVIRVKLHGPSDEINVSTVDLKQAVDSAILEHLGAPISRMARLLSTKLIGKYGDGKSVLWVETEITTVNDTIYGASAEELEE